MFEVIGNILELLHDLIFWKKKKARRKLEKEKNLKKKRVLNPISIFVIGLFLILIILKAYNFLNK